MAQNILGIEVVEMYIFSNMQFQSQVADMLQAQEIVEHLFLEGLEFATIVGEDFIAVVPPVVLQGNCRIKEIRSNME